MGVMSGAPQNNEIKKYNHLDDKTHLTTHENSRTLRT